MITLKALILSEKSVGESAKAITVLTAEKGVLHIFVRGGRKSSKNSSATQAFAYSTLCIDEKIKANGQTDYYLNSSENIKLFYNLRLDAKRMALASYFSQLLIYTGTENGDNHEVMRLALNTLYFLNEGKMPMELLRSVFEFRLLCEIGLIPKLLGCEKCCVYESKVMYFNFMNNDLTCENCCINKESIHNFPMDKTLLYIVRFIALTDFNRLFSFKVSQKYQEKLSKFTERFVGYHLKKNFPTLEFYKLI